MGVESVPETYVLNTIISDYLTNFTDVEIIKVSHIENRLIFVLPNNTILTTQVPFVSSDNVLLSLSISDLEVERNPAELKWLSCV